MIWAIIIAGGTGLLLGLLLKVSAVLAASVVAVAAGMVLMSSTNWPYVDALIYCGALLATLQIGYLLGGALACARSR